MNDEQSAAIKTVRALHSILLNGDQDRWITARTAQAWLNELRVVELHLGDAAAVEAERDRLRQEIVDARGEATAEAIRADVAEAQRDQAREIARDAIRVINDEYGFSDIRFVLDLPERTTPGLIAENYPAWLIDDEPNVAEHTEQQEAAK